MKTTPKKINLLDAGVNINVLLRNSAILKIPVVEKTDRRRKIERIRFLLGRHVVDSHKTVTIDVKYIHDLYGYGYSENVDGIAIDCFWEIKKQASRIVNYYKKYEGLYLVGDIHTHPFYMEKNYSKNNLKLSKDDIDGVVGLYGKYKLFKPCEPYVFGISGFNSNTTSSIVFYHLKNVSGQLRPRKLKIL